MAGSKPANEATAFGPFERFLTAVSHRPVLLITRFRHFSPA
jgi:hypothetical protein